jgi:hypothetical protein
MKEEKEEGDEEFSSRCPSELARGSQISVTLLRDSQIRRDGSPLKTGSHTEGVTRQSVDANTIPPGNHKSDKAHLRRAGDDVEEHGHEAASHDDELANHGGESRGSEAERK